MLFCGIEILSRFAQNDGLVPVSRERERENTSDRLMRSPCGFQTPQWRTAELSYGWIAGSFNVNTCVVVQMDLECSDIFPSNV